MGGKVDGDIILSAGLDTKNISKSVENLKKSISKGLKNVIRIGFGVRSVFALIRKMRSALIEGFQNLAQVHEPFNSAMSEIITSLNLLKNTFAAAFAPIVEVVAPILSQFINMIAEAVSQIGQLIAALTGKEYVRAAAVQMNYADTVNKSASNSKKAAKATKEQNKAAKELQKTLAGFDDVEILHEDKDSDTSADTTTASPSYSFSPTPIGQAVSQFATNFKAAWANADFTDIGRIVGEKIKSVLDSIPWDGIKETLRKVAGSIATFLNGYLSTPGLFYSIGTTIAQALNSAFEFVNTFATKFNWSVIGNTVRDKILGVVENIDWQLIYDTMRNLGRGIGTAIVSVLTNLPWNDIRQAIFNVGYAIATFLNNILSQPGLGASLGRTLSNMINSAIAGLQSFIRTFNWKALGTQIHDFLATAIAGINWKDVFATLKLLGQGLMTTINEVLSDPNIFAYILIAIGLFFLKFKLNFKTILVATIAGILLSVKTDFEALGKGLASKLNTAIEALSPTEIGEAFATLVNNAIDLITGFVDDTKFDELAKKLASNISTALRKINWAQGGTSVALVISKIVSALKSFVDEMDWASIGKAFSDFFVNALKDIEWPNLGAVIVDIGFALIDAITSFKWGAVATSLISGIAQALGGAVAELLIKLDPFVQNLIDAFTGFGGLTIEGLWEGIKTALANIGTWIRDNIFNPFIEGFCSVFGIHSPSRTMKPYGKYIIDGLLNGILAPFKQIVKWLKEHIVDPFIDGVKSLFGLDGEESVLYTIGSTLISGFIEGMGVIADTIVDWVDEHIITPITNGFNSLITGLDELFNGEENPFGTAAMEEATPITNAYTEALNTLGQTVGDASEDAAWLRMQQVINDLYDDELLSKEAFRGLNEQIANYMAQGVPLTDVSESVGATFEKANVSVDALNTALGNTPANAQKAAEGIEDLGSKSDTTQGNTSAVGEALTKFNGLSLTTPLKLAILSLAVRALGEKGKLSDEDVTGLQTTLDEYDPKKPEESMQKIISKFEATGVSAGDLGQAIADGSYKAQNEAKGNMKLLVTNLETTSKDIKTESKTGGKNFGEGYVEGVKETESDINRESAAAVEGAIGAMDDAADSHSPSRETYKRGEYLVQGLINGLQDASVGIANEARTIINTFVSQFDTTDNSLTYAGRNLIYSFIRGIDESVSLVNGAGVTVVEYLYGGINSQTSGFWNVGYNITMGMVSGLRYGASYVIDWARAIAINAFNAARNVLGIRSPSKKFAYIGEMITAGLSNGIAESGDSAVNAVADVTENIVDAAEKANPTISIQATVDRLDSWAIKLDSALTDFINRFSVFTTILTNLNESLVSYKTPEIATGNLLPSAINLLSSGVNQLTALTRVVETLSQSVITRDELMEVLSIALPRYCGDTYIGDEQLARHVNAGNLKLQYKHSIIK